MGIENCGEIDLQPISNLLKFDEKESYILFEESEYAFFLRHITNNHVSGQYFNQ